MNTWRLNAHLAEKATNYPPPDSDLLLTPAHVATVITGQVAARHDHVPMRPHLPVERSPGGEGKVCRIRGGHLPMPEAGSQLPCGGTPPTPLVLL